MRSDSLRSNGVPPVAVGVLLVISIYLAVDNVRSRYKIYELLQAMVNERVELAATKAERFSFESTLRSIDLNGGTVLAGYHVQGDSAIEVRSITDGLVYVMDVDCVHSAENISLLNALASKVSTVWGVVGVSLDDTPTELRAYATSNGLAFPLVAQPRGRILDVVPRHATPLSIFIRGGHVIAYASGLLDPDALPFLQVPP